MARAAPGGESTFAGLTGGKDSRLILALLIADGSADDVVFETYGSDGLADVAVARQIAASFDLQHVTNPYVADSMTWRPLLEAAVRAQGYDISSREIVFRVAAWACSGLRNAAEPHLGRLPTGDKVLFSGVVGEALRTNYPRSTRLRSKSQVAALPTKWRFGAAGIIRPGAREYYRRDAHCLLFENCRDTDSPQDAVDAFYIRNRLRRWFGGGLEINSFGRSFPLYSITAIRLAFAIGSESRGAEWIHYQLMRHACEPLADMAFAGRGWPDAASILPTPSRARDEPIPELPPLVDEPQRQPPRRSPSSVRQERRAESEAVDVDIMREYLRHDSSNPVFDIIDPVATGEALNRFSALAEPDRVQLFGALTAAIWLGGHEITLPRELARTQST